MQFNRTKNVKRNSVWGLISKIVGLLLPFAVRTVLIYSLGSEYLGLGSLFSSILTVLNLSELGVGSAIVFSMYKPLADDDEETVCALMNFYKKIYRFIGICVLAAGLLLLPFLRYLIKGDAPPDVNIYVLYLIYLINSCLSYWLFAYKNCILQANQRADIVSKNNLICNIVMHLAQIVLVLTVRNYYVYAVIIPLSTLAGNLLNAHQANKLFPHFLCNGQIDNNLKRSIGKRIVGLSLIKVAAVSRNSLDSIILSAFLGLTVVASYNNYFYISNSVSAIILVFTSSIAAAVGNMIATQGREENLKKMRHLNFMFMGLSGLCSVLMLNIYQPFMLIWVGKEMMFSDSIMVMFVIYFYLGKIGDVQAQYFDAAGLWWHGKWRGFIEAVANLSLNILLGYLFGVRGILLATIISIAVVNIPLSIYFTFKYYFKMSPASYMLDHLALLAVCLLAGTVSFFACSFLEQPASILPGIAYILIKVIICAAIYIVCFCILCRHPLFRETVLFVRSQIFKRKII
ncbi:MAG: polysaccharide biosynthesis protein [Cyanobacteriota bacterium]|nr:polysaccharide biosynthesis protein [Cyanobacteriota bacterium]